MKKISLNPYAFAFLSIFTILSLSGCGGSGGVLTREELIEQKIETIKNTPDWLSQIKADSEIKKQPLDTLIKMAATYVVDVENNKTKTREQRLEETVAKIKGTPDWFGSLQKDADTKKVSLDSLINSVANWTIDDEDGKHK